MKETKELVREFLQELTRRIKEKIVSKYLEENDGINPDFSQDEEYVIEPYGELEGISVSIAVDNSYLDVEETIVEQHKITALKVSLDETVFLEIDGYGNDEFYLAELSADDIIKIAERI